MKVIVSKILDSLMKHEFLIWLLNMQRHVFANVLQVRCFKVVGSLLSNQNTGMSENTTRIFISHERGNSTQDFTTSSH